MRLDKLIGKVCYNTNVNVYDWEKETKLFSIQYAEFTNYEEYMKRFKVRCIGVDKHKNIVIYVTEKED